MSNNTRRTPFRLTSMWNQDLAGDMRVRLVVPRSLWRWIQMLLANEDAARAIGQPVPIRHKPRPSRISYLPYTIRGPADRPIIENTSYFVDPIAFRMPHTGHVFVMAPGMITPLIAVLHRPRDRWIKVGLQSLEQYQEMADLHYLANR